LHAFHRGSSAAAPLPRVGARASATSRRRTAASRSGCATRASPRAPAHGSSGARWRRVAGLAVRVGVAFAVARLGVGAASAAHADVPGLDRPRLLAGRVVEVRFDRCRRATKAVGDLGDRQPLGLAVVACQRDRAAALNHPVVLSEEAAELMPSRYCSSLHSPQTSLLLPGERLGPALTVTRARGWWFGCRRESRGIADRGECGRGPRPSGPPEACWVMAVGVR